MYIHRRVMNSVIPAQVRYLARRGQHKSFAIFYVMPSAQALIAQNTILSFVML
jgi:hypothetical protein